MDPDKFAYLFFMAPARVVPDCFVSFKPDSAPANMRLKATGWP
jgi:hypothetical protein